MTGIAMFLAFLFLHHAYIRDKAKQGRVVMLDRIHWKKGWPYVEGNMPSNEAQAPKF